MTEINENRVRAVVQDELLGILTDARALLGTKDPTGMAKKALDGLANVIRRRQSPTSATDAK
jgi:hypothetical protein